MKIAVNMNAWTAKKTAAEKKIKTKAQVYVQRKVLAVLKDVLKISPQWSGNYVYNWRIEITGYTGGGWMKRFSKEPWGQLRGNEKYEGHMDAIKANLENNREIISEIKWNSKIALVNYAPVAEKIENVTVNLRPENLTLQFQGVASYLKSKPEYKFVKVAQ